MPERTPDLYAEDACLHKEVRIRPSGRGRTSANAPPRSPRRPVVPGRRGVTGGRQQRRRAPVHGRGPTAGARGGGRTAGRETGRGPARRATRRSARTAVPSSTAPPGAAVGTGPAPPAHQAPAAAHRPPKTDRPSTLPAAPGSRPPATGTRRAHDPPSQASAQGPKKGTRDPGPPSPLPDRRPLTAGGPPPTHRGGRGRSFSGPAGDR